MNVQKINIPKYNTHTLKNLKRNACGLALGLGLIASQHSAKAQAPQNEMLEKDTTEFFIPVHNSNINPESPESKPRVDSEHSKFGEYVLTFIIGVLLFGIALPENRKYIYHDNRFFDAFWRKDNSDKP